jgi:prepilin signal peptidase PulO-like enzyme (type II secretory pathway)
MNAARLTPLTSGFALAAAVTVLFSTAVAWAKDVNAPLKAFMKSLTDHDWTTHGLADLLLFVALGLIFTKVRLGEKMPADRVIAILIGAVAIAGIGLAAWFAFV